MILTGDLIEAYQRNFLNVSDLNIWAVSLLESGYDSEAVLIAASCSDLHWQEVRKYFAKILKELNITENIDENTEKVKEQVFLNEYQMGLRLGGQLLQKFDNLRKEIGFYNMVGFTIAGDEYKGNYNNGYHTLDRKLSGDELEKEIRKHLKNAHKI
jgi:hypothetical protein